MAAQSAKDEAIAVLASRQHGVVGRGQLLRLGLSRHGIQRRITQAWLHRIHRGVYAVGHRALTREGRWLAAILSCGDGAALSHLTAAVHWGLLQREGPTIHLTIPTRAGRKRRPGLTIHRSPLAANEVRHRGGIPVTSPARTLMDLAGQLPDRLLERALDEAEYLRLDLHGLAPRGRLARVIAARTGSTRTRNDFEEALLALCRRFRLPPPDGVNVLIEAYEVDFVWREQRLVVETDGYDAHTTRRAFERDRVRDIRLTLAGWRVVRITWRRLTREPARVADELGALLRRAGAPAAPDRR